MEEAHSPLDVFEQVALKITFWRSRKVSFAVGAMHLFFIGPPEEVAF